jgi:hypothetical protein
MLRRALVCTVQVAREMEHHRLVHADDVPSMQSLLWMSLSKSLVQPVFHGVDALQAPRQVTPRLSDHELEPVHQHSEEGDD